MSLYNIACDVADKRKLYHVSSLKYRSQQGASPRTFMLTQSPWGREKNFEGDEDVAG